MGGNDLEFSIEDCKEVGSSGFVHNVRLAAWLRCFELVHVEDVVGVGILHHLVVCDGLLVRALQDHLFVGTRRLNEGFQVQLEGTLIVTVVHRVLHIIGMNRQEELQTAEEHADVGLEVDHLHDVTPLLDLSVNMTSGHLKHHDVIMSLDSNSAHTSSRGWNSQVSGSGEESLSFVLSSFSAVTISSSMLSTAVLISAASLSFFSSLFTSGSGWNR